MINKKIAIIINSLVFGGGAERVASTLADELKKRGFDVSLLVFKDVDRKFKLTTDYIILKDDKEIKNSFDAFLAMFKRAKKIKEFCQEKKIDYLISFMEEANFASIISKIFFNNKIKLIISIRENPLIKKIIAKVLIKLLYSKADIVVANSKENEFILNKKLNIRNTKTIYNNFDFEKIINLSKEEIPEKYRNLFNQNTPLFINIGRLTKQKNQKVLINSFVEVVKFNKDAKLFIIGEGELNEDIKNLIKELSLENNIFLLPNQENVFKFLNQGHCFVLSSLWEGLPNTMIEAMVLGLSVISTDCQTGPREIIAPGLEFDKKINYPYEGKRGILVDQKNLGKAMIDFIKKGNFGEKEYNLEEFKAENVIKEWVSLINKPSPSPSKEGNTHP